MTQEETYKKYGEEGRKNFSNYFLIDELKSRIAEHESSAEEYFQEIGDEEQGNCQQAAAGALSEFMQWLKDQP